VEYETSAWPKLFTVSLEEFERRLRYCHYHVDVQRPVFLGKHSNQLGFPRLDRESLRIERLGIQDNAPWGVLGEVRAHRTVDRQVGRKIGSRALRISTRASSSAACAGIAVMHSPAIMPSTRPAACTCFIGERIPSSPSKPSRQD
jgi:hypothetical protein